MMEPQFGINAEEVTKYFPMDWIVEESSPHAWVVRILMVDMPQEGVRTRG